MTETKTITETRVVEQEIEVVECSSCECEVPKDDALEFTIGERDGWACEYCADEGPADFPTRESRENDPFREILIYPPIILCIIVGSLGSVAHAARRELKGKDVAYMDGIIGGLIYGLILGAVIGVLLL